MKPLKVTADHNGAAALIAVPPISSACPFSSSIRVCRRTTNKNINATSTAYSTVIFVIASSPALCTSRIGPYSATIPGWS